MSDKTNNVIYTTTKPTILMFPNLFKPRQYAARPGAAVGAPKYDAMLVFDADHPDIKEMRRLVAEIAQKAFPELWQTHLDAIKAKVPSPLRMPFKSGARVIADAKKSAEKKGKSPPDNKWAEGKVTITARSQYEPQLGFVENGAAKDYTGDARAMLKDKFFAGAEVLAELNFFPYGKADNEDDRPGVSAYLNKLVTAGKGTRIGGGKSTQEAFGQHLGALSAADPTEGMDEDGVEIPY